jgi:Tfp pilus assembly protein PilZ
VTPENPIPFRRRFPRRQFRRSVGVLAQGDFNVITGMEIGEGGLLFQSAKDFQVGSEVVLNFFIPGRDFVSVRGQIVYTLPGKTKAGPSFGIKFQNLPFEGKRMIRDYIAEKTSQEAAV